MNALSTYVSPSVPVAEPPATSPTAPLTGALTLFAGLLLGVALLSGGSDKKAKDTPRTRHLRGPATW